MLDLVPADRVFFTKLPFFAPMSKFESWPGGSASKPIGLPSSLAAAVSEPPTFKTSFASGKASPQISMPASSVRPPSRLSRRDRIVRWISSTMISLLIGDAFQLI